MGRDSLLESAYHAESKADSIRQIPYSNDRSLRMANYDFLSAKEISQFFWLFWKR